MSPFRRDRYVGRHRADGGLSTSVVSGRTASARFTPGRDAINGALAYLRGLTALAPLTGRLSPAIRWADAT